ncbi:MAG TPA: sulfatase-like hydrolase/transferase, partial [Nocardioides sp.]
MLTPTRRRLVLTRPLSVGLVAMALVLALGAGLGVTTNGAAAGAGQPRAGGAVALAATVEQPNIVFFLTDDMSSKHLRHMPSTRRLIFRSGARFTNFGINVSLCCPARASLLTGKYAHNTGITGNEYPDGFYGFHHGDEAHNTFPIALHRAGYSTSLLGKYLNDYPFVRSAPEPGMGVSPRYVPPGWSRWAVPIRGQYAGRKYDINLDGRIRHKEGARNYLGDFLTRRAVRQVHANRDGRGLAMLFSFYGPHRPEPA